MAKKPKQTLGRKERPIQGGGDGVIQNQGFPFLEGHCTINQWVTHWILPWTLDEPGWWKLFTLCPQGFSVLSKTQVGLQKQADTSEPYNKR